MQEMILFNGSPPQIRQLAREQGMKTLRESGLTKILETVSTTDFASCCDV